MRHGLLSLRRRLGQPGPQVCQAGSSVRPGTVPSSAFPGPRPSISRRDPRRRETAMSARQAFTVHSAWRSLRRRQVVEGAPRERGSARCPVWPMDLSATFEFGADVTVENEATGSSSSSLPRLGF